MIFAFRFTAATNNSANPKMKWFCDHVCVDRQIVSILIPERAVTALISLFQAHDLVLVSVSHTPHGSDLRSLLGLTVTDPLVAGEAPTKIDVAECRMRENVLNS